MLADRIKCTTSTTGTGALTLSATGVRSSTNGDCLAPAENLADLANRSIPYVIINGSNWAEGCGILSADGLTLTRDPFEKSWNGSVLGTGLLSLSGTSTVFVSPRAATFTSSDLGRTIAARQGAYYA
jgi:hypothetical protein